MYKLDRYHVDVYVPPWGFDGIVSFLEETSKKELIYSKHAKKKLRRISNGAVKEFMASFQLIPELAIDRIFEFYGHEDNVRKVCLRYNVDNTKYDLVYVISNTGKIVTIYVIDTNDEHLTLNRNLYIQGEINNA